MQQRVEILKMLYRNAEVLIFDEPTAVLTPQEIKSLFKVLNAMRNDGKSIIIITHKLNEVMEISDRVTVLRKGEHIATVNTSETTDKFCPVTALTTLDLPAFRLPKKPI